jgi:hypothetical protein
MYVYTLTYTDTHNRHTQVHICNCHPRTGHTADTLVLVEQGSQLGSSLILEARSRILDRESRKAARQQPQAPSQAPYSQQFQQLHKRQDAPGGALSNQDELPGTDSSLILQTPPTGLPATCILFVHLCWKIR